MTSGFWASALWNNVSDPVEDTKVPRQGLFRMFLTVATNYIQSIHCHTLIVTYKLLQNMVFDNFVLKEVTQFYNDLQQLCTKYF